MAPRARKEKALPAPVSAPVAVRKPRRPRAPRVPEPLGLAHVREAIMNADQAMRMVIDMRQRILGPAPSPEYAPINGDGAIPDALVAQAGNLNSMSNAVLQAVKDMEIALSLS